MEQIDYLTRDDEWKHEEREIKEPNYETNEER